MAKPAPDMVLLGRIGAAHGIAGAVRVKPFTANPLALGDYGELVAPDGRTFRVRKLRPAREVLVVEFAGVNDRTAAEALNGTELYVPRDRLPAAADDEFYHADLVGLAVVAPSGETIGTVVAVQNYGAGDLIEVERTTGGTVLVPFTRAAVPEIDFKTRRVVINPQPDLLD